MSDSFADLWASSAPAKSTPQQPPKKLGPAAPPRKPQYDAFSMLSAAQPSTRPVVHTQLSDRHVKPPQATSRGGDAFSTLFTASRDGATASRQPDGAHMTMAERAALAQQAKAAHGHAALALAPGSASLWEGLDALVRPTTTSPRPPASGRGSAAAQDEFEFGFDDVPTAKGGPTTTSPPNKAPAEHDDWGLSEFTSPTPSVSQSALPPRKPVPDAKPTTLWDMDEFGSSAHPPSQPRSQLPSRSLTGTPGDFDFGEREDGPRGEDSDGEDTFGIRGRHAEHPEDDILGDLGKPVVRSLPICVILMLIDECVYTLVSLSLALSKPVHVDRSPEASVAHDCVTTSTHHRPAGRDGFLARGRACCPCQYHDRKWF